MVRGLRRARAAEQEADHIWRRAQLLVEVLAEGVVDEEDDSLRDICNMVAVSFGAPSCVPAKLPAPRTVPHGTIHEKPKKIPLTFILRDDSSDF